MKETSVDNTVDITGLNEKSWFLRPWFQKNEERETEQESFRKRMQEIALYEREKNASELDLIISVKNRIEEIADSVLETPEEPITIQNKWFPRPWFSKQEQVKEDTSQKESDVLFSADVETEDIVEKLKLSADENILKDRNDVIISAEPQGDKVTDSVSDSVADQVLQHNDST